MRGAPIDPTHPASRLVDATGTRRRLEALAARGHPSRVVGAAMGRKPGSARALVSSWRHPGRRVSTVTAADVDRAYQQLRDMPGTSQKVRIQARKAGCLPPEVWDGRDIDDPGARPNVNVRNEAA